MTAAAVPLRTHHHPQARLA